MTKRDADVIARALADCQGADFEVVAATVADALEATHGRFDRRRFLDVCFGRTEEARAFERNSR